MMKGKTKKRISPKLTKCKNLFGSKTTKLNITLNKLNDKSQIKKNKKSENMRRSNLLNR